MSATAAKLLTAEEFSRRPELLDGSREELVRGKVVTMPAPGFRHGQVTVQIASILKSYVTGKRIGHVLAETGVRTERQPDTVRGPDVSFWSYKRVPKSAKIVGYPEVAADLCIEIRSPSNTLRKLQRKTTEYLQAGVRMVWIVDPKEESVTVYRLPDQGVKRSGDQVIDGEDVLPGFSCPASRFFED